MTRIAQKILLLFICIMLFHVFPAFGQEEQEEGKWTGKLSDGTVVTVKDIKKIFKEHHKLYEIYEKMLKASKNGKSEKAMRLQEEWLKAVRPFNLMGADLRKVNLAGANLEKVCLMSVDLSGSDLSGANLQHVLLSWTDLSGADLSGANLQNVDAMRARLTGADLRDSNLQHVDARGAHLTGADLRGANLNGANLNYANLVQTKMQFSILTNANLDFADLRLANMQFVNMSEAKLLSVDLRGADLYGAILNKASLYNAKGLPEVLKSFKKEGAFDKARLINYYIKLAEFENFEPESWLEFIGFIKWLFGFIFFLIFQYWIKPFWLLIILIGQIPFFAVFYLIALKVKGQKTGLWLILRKDHLSKAIIKERPFKLTAKYPWKPIPSKKLDMFNLARRRWDRMIRIGFYFSLLSAFNIGWRDINTKGLVTRLQKRDYALRPTGWARSLSGIQSLLSIFLLVLWLVATF